MKLTANDRAMIDLLRQDSRMSVAEMARRLGVSRPTAQKRFERLLDSDVFERFTVELNDKLANPLVQAFVSVVIRPERDSSAVATIKKIEGCVELFSVSGAFDYLVLVTATDIEELDRVVASVMAVPGVERTETSIVLSRARSGGDR